MDRLKKYNLLTFTLLLFVCIYITGCAKQNVSEVQSDETSVKSSETIAHTTKKTGDETTEIFSNKTADMTNKTISETKLEKPSVLFPMVMIDDKVYVQTEYVDNALKCGTPDGKITSSVGISGRPTKNDEANFGKGYGYQKHLKYNIITVNKDGKWLIFKEDGVDIDVKDIPFVAYFKCKVIKSNEDGSIDVNVIEIPRNFSWISRKYNILAQKDTVVNINLDTFNKSINTKELENKLVEIWFDIDFKRDNLKFNQIYDIKVVGS